MPTMKVAAPQLRGKVEAFGMTDENGGCAACRADVGERHSFTDNGQRCPGRGVVADA